MATVEGNPALPDINDLNEAEKRHLLHVIKRAKDFEVIEENKLRQPLEGVLSKFTNVVKGWQPRWFALDPATGYFNYYYMPSDYDGQSPSRPRSDQRPRGSMHLMGAVLAPSEEDSQTFNVSAANGEIYKLRAHDAKERQYWVNRLRATAESHNQCDRGRAVSRSSGGDGFAAALDSPATDSISSVSSFSLPLSPSANSIASNKSNASGSNAPRGKGPSSSSRRVPPDPPRRALPSVPQSSSSHALQTTPGGGGGGGGGVQVPTKSAKPPMATPGVPAPFRNVREVLFLAQDRQEALAAMIEDLPQAKRMANADGQEVPRSGEHPMSCLNKDLLQIKAASAATMSALDACLGILLVQQQNGISLQSVQGTPPTVGPPPRPSAGPPHSAPPPLVKQKSKSRILPTPPSSESPADSTPPSMQQQESIPNEITPTSTQPPDASANVTTPVSNDATAAAPVETSSMASESGVISDDSDAILGSVEGSISTPPMMRLSVAKPSVAMPSLASSAGVISAASPSDSFCSASDDQFLAYSQKGKPPSSNLVIPSSTNAPRGASESDQDDDDSSLLSSSPAAIVPVMEQVGPSATTTTTISALPGHYRHEDEQEDKEYKETDLGAVDEQHKSVILHLLSQLKMGMDLTKVVLPTFILERRSLLEMYADCMAHPNLFVNIANGRSYEDRMYAVFLWYLTSFHEGRKGAIAKKPYNPIIGETFRCSWSAESSDPRAPTSDSWGISYVSEQVSHHPPISAFYAESSDGRILLNASIWTKSKFMGMSVGVTLVGKVTIYIPQYGEEYVFTLPSAYARSILTTPWVELGDRVTICCPQSGYNAAVTFHTKPFYGGTLHKITGEVKGPDGGILYRTAGEWNGAIEITREATNETQSFDTKRMRVIRKRVRPVQMQEDNESRRLWQAVSTSLASGNVESATEAKSRLEQAQREGERSRAQNGQSFPWRFFQKEGEATWVHKDLDDKLSKANPSFRRNLAAQD